MYPTRSGRQRRLPQRFQDLVPSLLTSVPHVPQPIPRELTSTEPPPPSSSPPPFEPEPFVYETEPNAFGLYRSYTTFPQNDPEDEQCLDKACDSPGLSVAPDPQAQPRWSSGPGLAPVDESQPVNDSTEENPYAPFLNPSVFRLMDWYMDGNTTKTLDGTNDLVRNVILADGFDKEHFRDFSAHREARRLDEAKKTKGNTSVPDFLSENIWKKGSVTLRLPKKDATYDSETEAPTVTIDGIYYRSLREVVKTAFQDESARSFHYTPHRLLWKATPDSPPERVISELYNSDIFLEEHERLQKQPREPNCDLETAIASIMLWSDSTHLASFGNASLWPIYCYFGNQSKYERARPTQFAAHHLAYIPSVSLTHSYCYVALTIAQLPDWISDEYERIYGSPPKDAVLTHLKRELMHAIWNLILSDGFVEDYKHGIITHCADGIVRRLFPRLFTYSADYPEK